MDEKEYLEQLTRHLRGFSETEAQDIVSDIREHFRSGREAGKSEEEISALLGNPSAVVRAYWEENPSTPANEIKTTLRRIKKPAAGIILVVLVITGIFWGQAVYSQANTEMYGGGENTNVNLYTLFNCTPGQGYLEQGVIPGETDESRVYCAISEFLDENRDSHYCGGVDKTGFNAGLIDSGSTMHYIFSRGNRAEITEITPVLLGETEEPYTTNPFPKDSGVSQPSVGMKLYRLEIPVNENLTEYMTIDFCEVWRDAYIIRGDEYVLSHTAGRFYVNHLDGYGLSVDFYDMGTQTDHSYDIQSEGINPDDIVSLDRREINKETADGSHSSRMTIGRVWNSGGMLFTSYSGIFTLISVDSGMNVTTRYEDSQTINICLSNDCYESLRYAGELAETISIY
jgi:hypothetical protein